MGSLLDTQSESPLEQQSRAKSAPLDTRSPQKSLTMENSKRTPSPSQATDHVFQSPIFTCQNSKFEATAISMTPTKSSPEAVSAPSTPSVQRSLPNMFGLLTPSLPNFADFNSKTISIEHNNASHVCEETNAIQRLNDADTMTIDMTEEADTNFANVLEEPQENRLAQQQPACSDVVEVDEEEDSEADELIHTQYDRMQREIRDAQLAAEVGVSHTTSGTRRSTRLARKDNVKEPNPAVDVSKPSKKAQAIVVLEQPTSPPESSFMSEAVVQLPPDPNPAVLTLSWELQYPPGGSTHPSYRYPELDPRLLFNPSIVPLIEGLPSICAVPPLVLPMGWRHVTWSSLLPIVFDPNQQAFKLTPIGPLPLTCEEVQQGGLARYVPGGECHPEAGLLPDMTAFSDGSDEIFNFDGIDWVLPFAEGETFTRPTIVHGHTSPGRRRGSSNATSDRTKPVAKTTTPPIYLESRDCPDSIVDIEDAWHWMQHLENSPNTPFVPSPTKSWRGTGVRRTNRKTKAPIPSLMGAVVKDLIEHPEDPLAVYLLPQNGREFCAFKSIATPVHVNITLLKDIEITLVELLSYFPSHYQWRKAADRIVRAGMTAADVANMINYTRVLDGDAARLSSSVNDQLFWQYEAPGSRKRVKIVRDNVDEVATYTTEGWGYTVWELTDYPLFGLAHGLKHLPEGQDAGPLTATIKWCRDQSRYDTLLSDVPKLIDGASIKSLIESGEHGDPDSEVMGRFADVLKGDRRRVLRIAGERKRTAEKETGGRKKRVKSE